MRRKKVEIADISLSLSDIWRMLTDEEREIIRNDARIVTYKKNEIIYYEDEYPKDMMCLLHGKVRIFKSGVGGRSHIIRMIRPIQYFGYRAYFAKEPYVTAASAFEESTICLISMKIVVELISKNINFAIFFIQLLSVDLGIADERVVSLTQKHVRGRLAETLIMLRNNFGYAEDGITINIMLSREDLANLSNMTTSNAIRTLSTFVEEHLILLDGRKIKILNEEKLTKVSHIG